MRIKKLKNSLGVAGSKSNGKFSFDMPYAFHVIHDKDKKIKV